MPLLPDAPTSEAMDLVWRETLAIGVVREYLPMLTRTWYLLRSANHGTPCAMQTSAFRWKAFVRGMRDILRTLRRPRLSRMK